MNKKFKSVKKKNSKVEEGPIKPRNDPNEEGAMVLNKSRVNNMITCVIKMIYFELKADFSAKK